MSKGSFRSSDFVFRPTSLAARLVEAGMIDNTAMVREPVVEATMRLPYDKANVLPSKTSRIKITSHVPGSKSWIEARRSKAA